MSKSNNHAQQVDPNSVLLGRNQVVMAERAFEAYDFGEGVAVAGVSEWEYYAAGHERSREVYVGTVINDGKENPTTRLGFTVRYDPQTGALAEAYAEDATGTAFGCMQGGQLEKLNAVNGGVQETVAPAVTKKFLVPTFVVVEADSKEAADDLVGNMQRDYLEKGVSLYLDETLPTVQVDASAEREFFTVLDEPEVMEAVMSFRPQNDSLSPGM